MRSPKQPSRTAHSSSADKAIPRPDDLAKTPSRALAAGLEILEYLASAAAPASRATIASALGISRSVVSRSVTVLEQRGFIARTGNRAIYRTTPKLSQLPSIAPVDQRLLSLALPIMRSLCDGISQSCNLAVPSEPDMLVIAQQESSGPFGINVPLGFRYDIPGSAPGLAFAAFTKNSDPMRWPNGLAGDGEPDQWSAMKKAVQRTAVSGFSQVENSFLPDATDLSCPIFEKGEFVAVLTVPYIQTKGSANLTWCLAALQQAAEELNETLRRDALVA